MAKAEQKFDKISKNHSIKLQAWIPLYGFYNSTSSADDCHYMQCRVFM